MYIIILLIKNNLSIIIHSTSFSDEVDQSISHSFKPVDIGAGRSVVLSIETCSPNSDDLGYVKFLALIPISCV